MSFGNNAKRTNPSGDSSGRKKLRLAPVQPGTRVFVFAICFITWIILSGRFDLFHLGLGVIASSIVSLISADIMFPAFQFRRMPGIWLGFVKYIPWLLYQIFLANLHILYLTFHPRMKELIDPRMITFQSKLKDDMALLIFANSITLTPGTVTVHVTVLGKYVVHAIDAESARDLPGFMEEKVEKIFK
ncbi:MAG: Na+/H+ antiporter subunit E [Desulfosalsimonadaceae bacterium]